MKTILKPRVENVRNNLKFRVVKFLSYWYVWTAAMYDTRIGGAVMVLDGIASYAYYKWFHGQGFDDNYPRWGRAAFGLGLTMLPSMSIFGLLVGG